VEYPIVEFGQTLKILFVC